MASLKSIIRQVAPTLAGALGGPYAAAAVKAIADKLLPGQDVPDEAGIAAAIQADPEAMLKLTVAEQDFRAKMAEYGVELERIEAEDRASAREMQKATRDWVPGALACVFVAGFFTLLFLLARVHIPAENREVLMAMVGTMGGAVVTILTFYFGSSKSSQAKDAVLGRVVDSANR